MTMFSIMSDIANNIDSWKTCWIDSLTLQTLIVLDDLLGSQIISVGGYLSNQNFFGLNLN